jgi:6,7-dimethyl-8-ribityllumazine synthase
VTEQSGEYWPGEMADVDVEVGDDEDTGEEEILVVEELLIIEESEPEPIAIAHEESGHAPGALVIPDGVDVIEGSPQGTRKRIAVVVARFNGEVTNQLLESALAELDRAGIERENVTVMPVPGAFELPLGAMALAKTRRYVAVVALGCVIRGETAHFEYVAGEAASGLQLAALETGVPVSFGVLTTDTLEQATARADKGAEAVRSALEMADLFNRIRASAKASS